MADPTVEFPPERADGRVHGAEERPIWIHGVYEPIRPAVHEVRHLHQLEREGESEWTPWIALAGLVLFFATLGLLMFGIVEGASHLLMHAFSDG